MRRFLFLGFFLISIGISLDAYGCGVTFEGLADAYSLKDKLYDDHLGLYWPGFKANPGFSEGNHRGSKVEFNENFYERIYVIEGYEGSVQTYVHLLFDGENLVVQKSVNSNGHLHSYRLLRYLMDRKIQRRFQIRIPTLLGSSVNSDNENKSIVLELIPGGTMSEFFEYYREGRITRKQFSEGLKKLKLLLKRATKLESKKYFQKWKSENRILYGFDLPDQKHTQSAFSLFFDSFSRRAQNVRYFRGQWYVVDP